MVRFSPQKTLRHRDNAREEGRWKRDDSLVFCVLPPSSILGHHLPFSAFSAISVVSVELVLQQVISAEIGTVPVYFSQYDICALREKFFRQGDAKPVGVLRAAFNGILDDAFSVHAAHEAYEVQVTVLHLTVAGDRHLASSFELPKERPLAGDAGTAVRGIKKDCQVVQFPIIHPAFYAERALAYGRQADFRRNVFRDVISKAETLEARRREDNGIELSF